MDDRSDQYWATLQGPELLSALVEKVDDYYDFVQATGLRDLWERSHMMYQWGTTENVIQDIGKSGQFKKLRINHYRNILRHIHVGTTSQRPAFQPKAANTDYKSRAQVRACDGLLEYYATRKRGAEHQNKAAETALLTGEGYRFLRWDPNAGRVTDVQQAFDETAQLAAPAYGGPVAGAGGVAPVDQAHGRPIYEGDIVEENPHPLDVIRDCQRDTWQGTQWVIVRTRRNRYDLAALHPEKAQEILNIDGDSDRDSRDRSIRLLHDYSSSQSDDVYLYYFIHDRTPSLPQGRWVEFLDADTALVESDLEQGQVKSLEATLLRISGGEIQGIPFGYTLGFDLQAPQDAINIAASTAMTGLANADQILTGPAGSSAAMSQLGEGVRFIALDSIREGRIEVLDLMAIPDVLFKFSEMVIGAMETMSGVNSVTRGNPEASLKSGTALALVQSQFAEFNQDHQQGYAHMWEEWGTSLVHLFKTNVDEARKAAIVGKGNSAYVKELSGADIDGIDRVYVETSSYLSRTTAGRIDLAEKLLGAGLLKNASDFMYVIENGRLDGSLHDETDELMLIELENEILMEGGTTSVLVTDNDPLHIKKHSRGLFDPDARNQPDVVNAHLAHIQEHINQMQTKDPVLAAALGQPSAGGGAPVPGGPPPGGEAPMPVEGADVAPPADPMAPPDGGNAGIPV